MLFRHQISVAPSALELRRAPLLHLGRQRRARGAQGADAREVAIVTQRDARLHAVGKECRARAEEGHAGFGRKAPQHAPVGVLFAATGVAVKDDAGGAESRPLICAFHITQPVELYQW